MISVAFLSEEKDNKAKQNQKAARQNKKHTFEKQLWK